MKLLSVVVLGGTGFLGTRLVARLIKDGHRVTVLSRDREQHKHLLVLPGLTLENCDVYQEAQLSERFRGKDVVVNLVGILNERGFGGNGFRRAHVELTQAVLQAARSAGVPRLLQVSALKAAPDAPSYYLRSKGEAEKLIRDQSGALDWTILQPSVMFGPGDSFLNRFAGLLASVPGVFPLARAAARFQPVAAGTGFLCTCDESGYQYDSLRTTVLQILTLLIEEQGGVLGVKPGQPLVGWRNDCVVRAPLGSFAR